MNERFWELAKRADVLIDYGDDITVGRYSIGVSTEKMKKFAELIVKECSQYIEDKFDFCGDELIIAEKLLEHFGVE